MGNKPQKENQVSKSRFVLTAIVVMLILSFTISSVMADTQPPRDNAGDQPLQAPPDISSGGMAEQPDRSGFTVQPDGYVPTTESVSIDSGSVELYPAYEYVYTRKPTFYFIRDYGATKYEIEVASGDSGDLVFHYIGTATCPSWYCYIQSTTKLNVLTLYAFEAGFFDWRVRAKTADGWQPWSSGVEFGVLTKGFNNTFDTVPTSWYPWNGDWTWNESKGRLQTEGNTDEYNSVYNEQIVIDYSYTVRMKRKLNMLSPNSVLVWGYPTSSGTDGSWDTGIYFSYANAGDWCLWKKINGDLYSIQGWRLNRDAINEYGWNTLKVQAVYPYIDLWINGVYLGWYEDESPYLNSDLNYVGVDMYSEGPGEPLLVDSAVLTHIDQYSVAAQRDPAMQLGLEPVEGAPQRTGGDVRQR